MKNWESVFVWVLTVFTVACAGGSIYYARQSAKYRRRAEAAYARTVALAAQPIRRRQS